MREAVALSSCPRGTRKRVPRHSRFGAMACFAALGLTAVTACSSGSKPSGTETDAEGSMPGDQPGSEGMLGEPGQGDPSDGYVTGDPTLLNPTGEGIPPFEECGSPGALRKVKTLLTGLAPTDEEAQALASSDDQAEAMRALVRGWIDGEHGALFQQRMLSFFQGAFQQKGFNPTEDFKPQLLENGGFDFGVFGFFGDDAFPRLVRSIEESFARTAVDIMARGRPFTEVLSTNTFMMTTALASLYLQIEMPNDQPFAFGAGQNRAERIAWRVDLSGRPIPLEDTLNPNSPDYMTFSDEPPLSGATGFGNFETCQGQDRVLEFTGYAQLFQRLLGFTPRYPFAATPECWEHMSRPYFTESDLTDWRPVTIVRRAPEAPYVQPFDLPTLRGQSELALSLPRVGFYTTPAFLALWSTNDSNQHRVTANQTLLVALGQSFTSQDTIIPSSAFGLDAEHAVEGSVCYGCHKGLDPLRQFWASELDFNDRNDFPARVFGGTPNPRPAALGGALAFGNVNAEASSIRDLGGLLLQVTDARDGVAIPRFALEMTQKLCYWADSAGCSDADPEFRRIAKAFVDGGYDFEGLVVDLMSSPLVTGATATRTFEERAQVVSIARRDQLCTALSNRLGRPDLCALEVAFPFQSGFGGGNQDPLAAARSSFRIAGSVAADAFSRGSEVPVTPSDPNLFYRAASELLCEDIADKVVDTETDPVFSSANAEAAMADMVARVMGYPTSAPEFEAALGILRDNFSASTADGASPSDALKSTFALACQAPTSLGVGL